MKKLFTLLFALVAAVSATYATNGALSGRFTINAAGDQIVFSQGNLRYLGTWQFAEHQWDTIGSAQSDNHRDLFGWGTGDAPNKVSSNFNDYSLFTDWGVNAITNGGNEANLWRTLTKDEWVYLFRTRENAAMLFGLGSVNGVNGTILLPDNWTTPQGASFTASTTLGLVFQSYEYLDNNGGHFADNTYTAEQWSVMEGAGAVFLPAAGYRNGTNVYEVGSYGSYWSATSADSHYSYSILFNPYQLIPSNISVGINGLYYGLSVRLVQTVEKDAIDLTFSSAAGDEVEWYDYTSITGLWQIEADGEDAYIIIGNAGSNQAAGQYAWSDLDPDYCGVYFYALDSSVVFIDGSCTVTIDESDSLKVVVVVTGSFTGDDGKTYNVSITYEEDALPEPTRQANLTIAGLELEVYEGAWLLSGYNTDSTTYVRLAAFGDEISGEYTAYEIELDYSYLETDIAGDSSNVFDLLDANLNVVFDETDNTIVVTGTILGQNEDDVPLFTVNLSGQIVSGEGLENVVQTKRAQKVIIDGAVYIIHDNKLFNVLGRQVRVE